MHWKMLTFVAILVLGAAALFRAPFALAQETQVNAHVGVYPSHIANVPASHTFTVRIYINSTVPFVGYQFYLFWNRTYINATGLVDSPPAVWIPFYAGKGLKWDYNATHGRIEKAALDLHMPKPNSSCMDSHLVAVTGNFTVATITFSVLMDLPPSTIVPLDLDHTRTILAGPWAEKIRTCVHDDEVHIVGEVTNPSVSTTNATVPKPSIQDSIPISMWDEYPSTHFDVHNTSLNDVTSMNILIFISIASLSFIIVVVLVVISISLTYHYRVRKQSKIVSNPDQV